MPRLTRARLAGGFLALAGGLSLTLAGPAAPALAESYGLTAEELQWCAMNGSCLTLHDTATWALRTATWKYPESVSNDGAGDAFRHCIWSGSLAQRVGYDDAYTTVLLHEADEDGSEAATMDAFNDYAGLEIGVQSNEAGTSDTWGWIMNKCEERLENGELFGLGGAQGKF